MELFVLWTMVKHGKMCPIRSFSEGFVMEPRLRWMPPLWESLIADRNYNPLIPDNLADPSVSKFGDIYYLYGTTDLDYGLGRAGTPVVWKSKDFVNWSFEGSHISGFDWSKGYDYTNDKGEKKKGYFRYWAPGK